MCPHGNCATACGAIDSPGHCLAKVVMYCRFRGEKPVMSGNSLRRLDARRAMTLLPHASCSWRASTSRPIPQYSSISCVLTARYAVWRALRTRSFNACSIVPYSSGSATSELVIHLILSGPTPPRRPGTSLSTLVNTATFLAQAVRVHHVLHESCDRGQSSSRRMSTRGNPSSIESVEAALVNPARSNNARVPTYAMVRSTCCPWLSTGYPSIAGAP